MVLEGNLQPIAGLFEGSNSPRVFAHRGLSSDFPENTLSAFRAAANHAGVKGIELDVQLTRDGIPVVFHDECLVRLGRAGTGIRDLEFVELSRIDAGSWFDPDFSDERIPSLEQTLAVSPGSVFLVELKSCPADARTGRGRDLVHRVIALLEKTGNSNRCVILCFDSELLLLVKELQSEVHCMLNVCKPPGNGSGDWVESIRGFEAVDISICHLNPAVVQTLHDAGLLVLTYTCNTADDIRKACDCNVDGIITDFPDRVLGHLT